MNWEDSVFGRVTLLIQPDARPDITKEPSK